MKRTALIMAGGRGERFWPRSRKNMPKQFLSLDGSGKTMIQLTVERILPLIDKEDIFIVTNIGYKDVVREQLPDIPEENILCEPAARNTAPCIGLGAVHIRKKYGEAIMYVFPSDHLIKYSAMFQRSLKDAAETAEENNCLVTLGITPAYPETGYGYIKFDPEKPLGAGYAVEQFTEKPSLETANRYLAEEQYLWNSGMFIWKLSVLLENMEKLIPDTYAGLTRIESAIGTPDEERVLNSEFSGFRSESIDYAIMEHAENICVLPSSFGWDDVGSWLAVSRIQQPDENGNTVAGDVITIGTRNSIIQGGKRLIAAVGIDDAVIVDADDAILICGKSSVADIKKVLENLKICNRRDYL